MTSPRFTFHKPQTQLTVATLALVRDEGVAIGHVNRTSTGYVIRDLDGNRLESLPGVDRRTAAGVLAQTVSAQVTQ